jgi:hypothetical protein
MSRYPRRTSAGHLVALQVVEICGLPSYDGISILATLFIEFLSSHADGAPAAMPLDSMTCSSALMAIQAKEGSACSGTSKIMKAD